MKTVRRTPGPWRVEEFDHREGFSVQALEGETWVSIAHELSQSDAIAMATLPAMWDILDTFVDASPWQTEALRVRARHVMARARGEE